MNQAIRKFRSGARFFKADLHTHTPASRDFPERGKTAQDYVQAALSKGLDIVAVTDHNSAEWVDLVRKAAAGTSLYVFPGVEVTTPVCHILAIFDLNTPKATLEDFLSAVGISSDKRGREEALSDDLERVLEKIEEFGGLAIASHANSDNGLLKQTKGQYKLRICRRDDLSALEFASRNDVEKFTQGQLPEYGRKACVQGSDAHDLGGLGQRFTHLKMDGVCLRGIQQAFFDYEVRVRFDWDFQPPTHPQIITVRLNQGFLGGILFEFHPNLNCVVGGKGTGKSTLVEFMRYCFDDISTIGDIAEDTRGKIAALLGEGGTISVEYLDADGEVKLVEREFHSWDTERTVRSQDGDVEAVLANPVFFSQGELTRIAASSVAQLDLIDRYVDVSPQNGEEARLVEELNTNAAGIQEVVHRVQELETELEDPETGLAATQQRYAGLEKSLRDPVLRDFPKWESENRYLEGVADGLHRLDDTFGRAVDRVSFDQLFPPALDASSPNYDFLAPVGKTVQSLPQDLEAAKSQFSAVIGAKMESIERLAEEWETAFSKKRDEHDEALRKLGELDVRRAQSNLRALRTRLDALETRARELNSLRQQIDAIRRERGELRRGLDEVRSARFQKRAAKAKEWESALQGKVKVGLHHAANRREYFEKLRALAKGSMLREQEIRGLAEKLAPHRLIDLVQKAESDQLAEEAGIKPDNARKLVHTLQSRQLQELFELETIAFPDLPDIRYEVEVGRDKPLHELSVGQKGTVIISLALIEGQTPLVIDQPEEPLDTLAIYDQVVGTLRRQKEGRQFVFTTHNANVAVGADADLNYVLDATADKGNVKASGGIDREETNRLLLLHLEGGPEAFDLRSGKYRR